MNRESNLAAVEQAAAALGDLSDELVLVGGCTVGLLVTDTGQSEIRATVDVDWLTEVTPLSNYYEFCDRLRARGFTEQRIDNVICRWVKGRVLIDVMPTDEKILGFTNSWYRHATRNPMAHVLPSGKRIRIITPPYLLATKLEAFFGRGNGDFIHHDMEDIVTVIDGRATIVDDVLGAEENVRAFLMDEFETLLTTPSFIDRMSWLLPQQEIESRQPIVIDRMRRIAGL